MAWTMGDLKAVDYGGILNEDFMNQIWDASRVPLAFQDRVGTGERASADYKSWIEHSLATPSKSSSVLDGSDQTGGGDENGGARVGNHVQVNIKKLKISTGAENSDSPNNIGTMAEQVVLRQQELRRDIETRAVCELGSVEGTGAVKGESAGLDAVLTTNTFNGVGGVDGGFASGLVTAYTAGTPRTATELNARTMLTAVWTQGADPDTLMGTPKAIEGLSQVLFDTTARVATLQTETSRDVEGNTVAKGAVNVLVSDHSVTVELVGNRLMLPYDAAAASSLLAITSSQASICFKRGVTVEPLAKTGLSEQMLMSAYWTLCWGAEYAHGALRDLDEAAPFGTT